jgi:hypothetical protein
MHRTGGGGGKRDRCKYSTAASVHTFCLGRRRCRALHNLLPFDRITRGRISRGHARNLDDFIITYKCIYIIYVYGNVCTVHLDAMPKYVKSPFPVFTARTNLSHIHLRRRRGTVRTRFLNRKRAQIYTRDELRPIRCRAKRIYTRAHVRISVV